MATELRDYRIREGSLDQWVEERPARLIDEQRNVRLTDVGLP